MLPRKNSVKARALVHSGTCGIGILFSGGLDCMIIAALVARCVADLTVIDLFNIDTLTR
jgi:asparagine synthetase B (glutamine-hydrolysing)